MEKMGKEKKKRRLKKMVNENIRKNKVSMINGLLVVAFMLLVVTGFVVAEGYSSEDLVVELNNLSSDLSVGGYDWLVNYSVDYPSADIEVYLEDGVGLGWLVNGIKISYDIFQKKKRMDEIMRLLE